MPLLKEQKDATKFILVEFACNCITLNFIVFKSILHFLSRDIEQTMQSDLFYYAIQIILERERESKLYIFAMCLILKT